MSTVLEIPAATSAERTKLERLTAAAEKTSAERQQLEAQISERLAGWEAVLGALDGARGSLQSARGLLAATETWLQAHFQYLSGTAVSTASHGEAGRIMREWGATRAGLPALVEVIGTLETAFRVALENAKQFAEKNSVPRDLLPAELRS